MPISILHHGCRKWLIDGIDLGARVGVHLVKQGTSATISPTTARKTNLALAAGQRDVDEPAGVDESLPRTALTVLMSESVAPTLPNLVPDRNCRGGHTGSSSSPVSRPWGSET